MEKDQGQEGRPQGTSASQHLRKNRLLRSQPLDGASRTCSSCSALWAGFTTAAGLACRMSQSIRPRAECFILKKGQRVSEGKTGGTLRTFRSSFWSQGRGGGPRGRTRFRSRRQRSGRNRNIARAGTRQSRSAHHNLN